jgi:hypothetical protein
MKTKGETTGFLLSGLAFLLGVFIVVEAAQAVTIDDERTLELTAKLQSRVSMRLQASEGFTFPLDIAAGNLAQWRNIAYLEVQHDLRQLMSSVDALKPLKRWGVEVKYRIVGRFLYEAIYDVGPSAFQDVKDYDKEDIDSFAQQYDLWEACVDFSKGPFFTRIGRQNLSWGETDVFRLMDLINPLDNTFGGPFEDLDDRRIPLWMLRASWNFGYVGPVASVTLEGFWVPGTLDVRVAPVAPRGTAYAAPLPEVPFPTLYEPPDKEMKNSRWGVRLMGVVAESVNVSIGHYKSFLDVPGLLWNVEDTGTFIPNVWLAPFWDDVQVTGFAMNWWESMTDVVVRSEVAVFWDEAVFIPEISIPLVPSGIPIPGLDLLPAQGDKAEKNILRFMLGLDKNLWLRKLNKLQTFFISLQYFGQDILNYDDRIKVSVPIYPDASDYPGVREIESVVTMLVNTSYMSGRLTPQMVLAYDVRGAWLVMPSLNYIFEPFRFMIQYSAVAGSFTNFGFFRDRDQITFIFSYLLN